MTAATGPSFVYLGTSDFAARVLATLAAADHRPALVVAPPDRRSGRGRRLSPPPVASQARELGLELHQIASVNEDDSRRALLQAGVDLGVVCAFGQLIGTDLLTALPMINAHPSLLPRWRGAAPIERAIMAGDDVTGAAVFQLEAGMDTGPVFGVVTEGIGPKDTAGDLLGRLAESGAELLVKVLDGIEDGTLNAVPQLNDGVSMAPKITVEDARVRWDEPAMAVDRRIRGCTPAPGAWSMLDDLKVKLHPVTTTDEVLPAGQVRVERNRVLVGTATTAVELGTVQPAGKKAMKAADWARGLHGDGLAFT